MKNIFKSLLAVTLVIISLTSCTIPGIIQDDEEDDYFFTKTVTKTQPTVENYSIKYNWLLKPKIYASNIISFDGSQLDPSLKQNKSYLKYSICFSDGKYGFIDYSGNKIVKPKYKHFYFCTCGEMVLYNVSDDEYEYCTIDSKGNVTDTITEHAINLPTYFWDENSKKTYVNYSDSNFISEYTGNLPVLALKTEVTSLGNGNYAASRQSNPKYGLVINNKIKIDFEYDDFYAPSFKIDKNSVFALKKDGKWGYFNGKGKEIISFKCKEILSSDCGEVIDHSAKIHPYLFSDKYLPAVVDSGCCYFDSNGNCIVPTGEFEQARPVLNGRAWVKQNGYWGVVNIGKIVEEERSTVTKAKTTTSIKKYSKTSKTSKTDKSKKTSVAKKTTKIKTTKKVVITKKSTTKKTIKSTTINATKPVVKTTTPKVTTTVTTTTTTPPSTTTTPPVVSEETISITVE